MPKVVAGYKEAARARIIEAAFEVFTKRGFDDSTMDEVAEKVGVSKAALYRYFPSKDALLEGVFIGTQGRMREILEQTFEGRKFGEGVKVFFDEMDRTYGKGYDLALEWFAEACRNGRVRKLMRADGERDIETVSAFLESLRKKGKLRTRMNTRALAQILETAMTGAWIRTAAGHDREDVIQSVVDLVSMIESRG